MDMQKHNAKGKAPHRPPAYDRYRKNHPIISLVLTKELKELLDAEKQKDDLSYSKLIRKFILQGSDVVKVRKEGYTAGYSKAAKEAEKKHAGEDVKQYNAGFNAGKVSALKSVSLGICMKCGKPMFFDLTDPIQLKELGDLLRQNKYAHEVKCQ